MEPKQHRVACWPSGVITFDGQTLEMTAAEERIPREDLRELTVKKKAGRLNLRVHFQAGLGTHRSGVWVEPENGEPLRELLSAAEAGSEAKLSWES